MTSVEEPKSSGGVMRPGLWEEVSPDWVAGRLPWWVKWVIVAGLTAAAILWLDGPVARWALEAHPAPDLADRDARQGDIAREFMLLEQWGQWAASILAIMAVMLLDKKGRQKGLAIATGCVVTLMVAYLLKDLVGRSRPMLAIRESWPPGTWEWGGPRMGFQGVAMWTSFPSAHATGAFALSAGLAWFYPRGRLLFMGLACFTAVLRVLHRAHFPSDVIAGMGIAIFVTRLTLRMNMAGWMIRHSVPAARRWWLQEK